MSGSIVFLEEGGLAGASDFGRSQRSCGARGEHPETTTVELARSCHYAVRGLVFLAARSHPDEPVLLRDIAVATNAPEAFLSKIFQSLRAAGIVRSHRGTSRGYALAGDPAEISLYDIVVATEGPASLHTSDAVAAEGGGPFAKVWTDVESLIANRLRSTTVKDLVSLPAEGTGGGGQARLE